MSQDAHRILDDEGEPTNDRPWIIRTYAGHSSPEKSNALYRSNLERGQRGLSIAFDLPTQCGYSSDHPLARPEIGKVGVPINSLDDFHVLFDGIPIEKMNTSMTINATSMWMLALYIGLARERGVDEKALRGTTQNDIVKEYLARGTFIFPPEASLRMIAEMYEYALDRVPNWNASNICSYHLQEAGATPIQELSFALANAIGLLDLLKERGRFDKPQFERAVGRISFFVNAGIRFVEEMCKMRAFTAMWQQITAERYGVENPKYRRFRYGVQVNSLGLTEAQPENNAWRILIETLGVTLSRDARCRALQLPAWNEALSLPREWDQQWMIRLQQILAYETDLLEYPDLFEGSKVVESKVADLMKGATEEIDRIIDMGGVRVAVETGYLKSALVGSMSDRMGAINRGDQIVVGVNKWTEAIQSPLVGGDDGGVFRVDASAAEATLKTLAATKAKRDDARVKAALAALDEAARSGGDMMEASIECALARVTTGEWSDVLRGAFGEYRPATGIDGQSLSLDAERVAAVRARVEALTESRGRRPKIVVGKPGLDGHSNGAEVIAVAARHCGFDVVYGGIRLTAEDIAQSAVEEDADVIGVSILSGSHMELSQQLVDALKAAGGEDIPLVLGGIVPDADKEGLINIGVRAVFTPSDFDLVDVIGRVVEVIGG